MAGQMLSVYFDVHIFDDLFFETGKYHSDLNKLQRLASNNRLRVFGSAKQFEELSGLATTKPEKYKVLAQSALQLTGKYFLRDRKELCIDECRKRKKLSIPESCMTLEQLFDIYNQLKQPELVLEFWSDVRANHERFKDEFQQLSDQVCENLAAQNIHPEDLGRETSNDWGITKHEVNDWISRSILFTNCITSSIQVELSKYYLPVMQSWYAYIIAHAKMSAISGRKVTRQDRGDWEHYAYAAVAGCFVTNDRNLRDIASHIKLRHVRVWDGEQFIQEINRITE